jgi:thiol-disulfide isomerase/thioredoxin
MKRRLILRALAALVALPLAVFAAAASKDKPAKPQHISHGEKVNLQDYVVPGKTTVFDFYSDYCPPCVRIAPELEKLHAKRADIVVIKVDINRPGVKGIDWESAVAKQHVKGGIPHFKIFGPDGKLIAEDGPTMRRAADMVGRWLE